MIVDTGVLYALADRSDAAHSAAVDIFKNSDHRVVPEAVIVQTDYLIQMRLGIDAELAFLDALVDGSIAVEPTTRDDRVRAAQLARTYRDSRIGYVDAIIVAMAERLREHTIATLDRRHFAIIRPAHLPAFTLVPD